MGAKLELAINATAMVEECDNAVSVQRGNNDLALGCVLAAGVEADGFHLCPLVLRLVSC